MAEINSRAAVPSDTLAVRIYAGVGRDYRARGVFPQLTPPVASGFVFDGTATYLVTRAVALEVLADAKAQHARPYGGGDRGTKKSYLHIIEQTERLLDPEKWAKLDAEAAEQKR